MRKFFLIFLTLLLCWPKALLARDLPNSVITVVVQSTPVPLNQDDPRQNRIGALIYRGGVELHSTAPAFGGFSGLAVTANGQKILAVSDAGSWMIAELREEETGRLMGLDNVTMAPLLRSDGQVLGSYNLGDAEAVSLNEREGSALVAFESRDRIWRYRYEPANGVHGLLTARPEVVETMSALKMQPANRGVEALVMTREGELMALSEGTMLEANSRMGWRLSPQPIFSFVYKAPLPFEPTDAVELADGRLAILNRHASFLGGLRSNLVIAPKPHLQVGFELKGEVVARFVAPFITENFEGLATRQDAQGRIFLYLISDDNFSNFQRNLLLKFELETAVTP